MNYEWEYKAGGLTAQVMGGIVRLVFYKWDSVHGPVKREYEQMARPDEDFRAHEIRVYLQVMGGDIEDKIIAAFEEWGYECWASGWDGEERELCFLPKGYLEAHPA